MAQESSEFEQASKASWDWHSILAFCDACLKEIEIGNMPGTHFNKVGWENIISSFAKETGKHYDKLQLKNKWDQMKKEWKLWKKLLKGETGLGWDPRKRTIDASNSWWEEKITRYPDAKKFRKMGIEPELEDKMDTMFEKVTAQGNDSFAPSSGQFPSAMLEQNDDGPCNSDGSDVSVLPTPLGKRKVGININEMKKRGRMTGAEKLSKQIDRLVGSLGNKNKAPVPIKSSEYSITGNLFAELN